MITTLIRIEFRWNLDAAPTLTMIVCGLQAIIERIAHLIQLGVRT